MHDISIDISLDIAGYRWSSRRNSRTARRAVGLVRRQWTASVGAGGSVAEAQFGGGSTAAQPGDGPLKP